MARPTIPNTVGAPPDERYALQSPNNVRTLVDMVNEHATALDTLGLSAVSASSVVITTTNALDNNPVTLVTEGTVDWFAAAATAGINPRVGDGASCPNQKSKGGDIAKSLVFITKDWTAGTLGFQTRNSTVADDAALAALASNTTCPRASTAGATLGTGFRFQVPAVQTNRVMRIYTHCDGIDATLVCTFDDGTTATATQSLAANVGSDRTWTINYSSKYPQNMTVSLLVTAINGGATIRWCLGCVTVGIV